MRDLSSYIAGRTCRHVREIAGGATFADRAFERLPGDSRSFRLYNNYIVSVKHNPRDFEFYVEKDGRAPGELEEKLLEIMATMPRRKVKNIREVLYDKLELEQNAEGLVVRARLKIKPDTRAPVKNPDKIFYALYRAVVQPLINLSCELP